MFSVLILTKNEAADLPRCLASVAASDDVHVFDSFSTDETVELARRAGAQVSQRQFDHYAAQRNAALHTLSYKHEWVLILDADECLTPALATELAAFLRQTPADVVACRIRRRDFFRGRWLKHAQISPFYLRFVRPQAVHYEREINEVLVPHGPVRSLDAAFDHFPFSKGLTHWFRKHNDYSSREASQVLRTRAGLTSFSLWKAFFERDFHVRRLHQKELFYRLPCRPLIKFVYIAGVRRGFLDGSPGLTYALLQSIYEYMIVLKTRELQHLARGAAL